MPIVPMKQGIIAHACSYSAYVLMQPIHHRYSHAHTDITHAPTPDVGTAMEDISNEYDEYHCNSHID